MIFFSAGVWIDSNHEVMYALASKIKFICQMDFNAFPVDIQVINYIFSSTKTSCLLERRIRCNRAQGESASI